MKELKLKNTKLQNSIGNEKNKQREEIKTELKKMLSEPEMIDSTVTKEIRESLEESRYTVGNLYQDFNNIAFKYLVPLIFVITLFFYY
tara:strand:+ start:3237 stop:3500 length:264 start_codon:yes stop_codon:yes gene_type:complete